MSLAETHKAFNVGLLLCRAGIAWMYAHTFAITEESVATVSIVDLGPAIRKSSGGKKLFRTLYTINLHT